MKQILLTLSALLLFSFQVQNNTFKIVDSHTQKPIEGARVYIQNPPLALRSDNNGLVQIPQNIANPQLTIRAKNYRSIKLQFSATGTKEIAMIFDSTLVNPIEKEMKFTQADTLRGAYGPFRANNDLLFYDLNIRLDIEKKFISGYNTITFKMLQDDSSIQIDLFDNMKVDSIVFEDQNLNYQREFNAVFIDFPYVLQNEKTYSIDFYYSGNPIETGRFGGIAFKEDSLGNPWIYTACQGIGASLWWPNKDQQRDEVDSMNMSVAIPSDLIDVSNGRFQGRQDLGDGYTRYDWKIHYPINNYSVSINIAKYTHFSEMLDDLTLDFWVLPNHLEQAKIQFAQAKPMIECYQKMFGPYPFPKDGYKLIEVPYSGMEHQSAVTYGNLFKNGYLGRDWTEVGISTKFDFIIIHESGHEWFGNSVTASDVSDAWIQEGWTTYAEGIYVECMFGYEEAIKYFNGYKSKVKNLRPIIGPTAVNSWPTGDQYFKGALFLNTLRHIVDDDAKWFEMLRDFTEHFKYKNIFTAGIINFFNNFFGHDFSPVFEQYLYYADLPVLEIKFTENEVSYRWQADVADFNMPIKVRTKNRQHIIKPTNEWNTESLNGVSKNDWQIATDLYYIVTKEIQ